MRPLLHGRQFVDASERPAPQSLLWSTPGGSQGTWTLAFPGVHGMRTESMDDSGFMRPDCLPQCHQTRCVGQAQFHIISD